MLPLMEALIPESPAEDTSVKPPLSFTPDQLAALGLDGSQEVGKEITVTLRAGEAQEDGSQSFEVVNHDEGGENETPSMDAAESTPTGEDESAAHSSEGPPNLGYDIGKSRQARSNKKPAPLPSKSFV